MRKKLKADSVDELFEIVKAVQNGEEPEEYAKRKREEALRAEREAEEAEKRKREKARAEAEAARRKREEARAEARAAKRKREEARVAEQEAEEAAKRKREEARAAEQEAEGAAKRKREEARAAEQEAGEAAKRKREEVRAAEQETGKIAKQNREEDFERLLDEDQEEEFDGLKAALQGVQAFLAAAGGFLKEKGQAAKETLAGWKEKASGNSVTGSEIHTDVHTDEPHVFEPEKQELQDRTRELGRVHLADIEKESVGKTRRRYGAKSISEESETIGKRILHSLHMDPVPEHPEEKTEKPVSDEIDADSIDLDTVQILDRLLDVPEKNQSKAKEVPETAKQAAEAEKRPVTAESGTRAAKGSETAESRADAEKQPEAAEPAADAEKQPEAAEPAADAEKQPKTAEPKTEAEKRPETAEPKAEAEKQLENAEAGTEAEKSSGATGGTPDSTGQAEDTAKKAVVKLRYCVIGIAAVLIIVTASLMFGHFSKLQEKQKYVTADEGLTITVENQPAEWCSSYELKMRISVRKAVISSIEINGTAVEADDDGYVTAVVQSTPLDVVVTTEEGTLNASVEIPMLDAEAPSVTAELTGGQVVLSAADTRSGVAKICYAVVEDSDWLQLPQYQEYSEPIAYEEDCMYYFYAVDQAGNCSAPVCSNMKTAESVTLSESELTLYPEETAQLDAEVNPSGALLTDLHYESSNTEVAVVSSSGLVTAVAEGTALIKAVADGVETATCTVTVAEEAVITVSAIGDCTLGTYKGSVTSTSFDTYYSMYGASWFFQNVKDILSNDDVTFANLEGPLTESANAADKTYAFKGDPSYTEILQDGSIEVVTLANNHSSDYGSEGLADTKENLTAAGIDYCIGDTVAYQEISGIKTAFIGIYELSSGLECETQVRETIAEAQSEGAQLIIVAFHWGSEKENYADETQQSLAHTAIDCGADLVVGHHPHVLQGIEKYNGKYIVYSLGNFCFGGNSNPSDKDTMIFRQTFTITADGVTMDDDIEIIPCTISSASDYNDYRPTPAAGTAADEIMERINEYSAEFGDITYTASTGL